jgi:DNA-binding response OmpR family regulator
MGERPSLLLVEDDESLRGVLARHLAALGFAVGEAASAEAATSAVRRGLRPDLVILDLNLPGKTGWDLLRGPWLLDAGGPPVLITSATTVSPSKLAEFHVAGYLPKPFPIETLVAAIERLLPAEGDTQEP